MSVIGIDIGTYGCIVATIQKRGISIIINELSERVTPSLVAYVESERFIGEAAKSMIRTNHHSTCRYMKQLISSTNEDIDSVQYEKQYSLAPIEMFSDGAGEVAGYRVKYKGNDMLISATRCLASLLTKVKQTVQKSLGNDVRDAVISVPSYASDRYRKSVIDAATIAGLNCLCLMNETTAAALDYGIYRSNTFDTEKSSRVAFVGMGHGISNVCIVDFTNSKLKILISESDKKLGGRDFETAIVNHFAEHFYIKYKKNLLDNIKAKLKLEEAAAKAKKVLSASPDTLFTVDCVVEDYDICENFTRAEFEQICQPLLVRFQNLLESTFKKANIDRNEIKVVELVGNSTRIPCVQEVITNFFEKRLTLSKTLSMDEVVARGCVLQAAIIDSRYKVKEFAIVDYLQYDIFVSWLNSTSADCQATETKTSILFEKGSSFDTYKWLTFQKTSNFELQFSTSVPSESLKILVVLPEKYSSVPQEQNKKIKVKAHLTLSGIISVTEAYLIYEESYEEMVKEKKLIQQEPKDKSNTNSTDPTDNVDTEQVDNSATQPNETTEEPKYEEILVPKKKNRVIRLECQIQFANRLGYYTDEHIKMFTKNEEEMIQNDLEYQYMKESINELETYTYFLKEKLNEEWRDFVTVDDLNFLQNKLVDVENWVYDNAVAPVSESSEKLQELKQLGNPIEYRYNEYCNREQCLADSYQLINTIRDAINSNDYKHIPTTKLEELSSNFSEFIKRVNEVKIEHHKWPLTQNPPVLASDLLNEKQKFHKYSSSILIPKAPEAESVTPDSVDGLNNNEENAKDSKLSEEGTPDTPSNNAPN